MTWDSRCLWHYRTAFPDSFRPLELSFYERFLMSDCKRNSKFNREKEKEREREKEGDDEFRLTTFFLPPFKAFHWEKERRCRHLICFSLVRWARIRRVTMLSSSQSSESSHRRYSGNLSGYVQRRGPFVIDIILSLIGLGLDCLILVSSCFELFIAVYSCLKPNLVRALLTNSNLATFLVFLIILLMLRLTFLPDYFGFLHFWRFSKNHQKITKNLQIFFQNHQKCWDIQPNLKILFQNQQKSQ